MVPLKRRKITKPQATDQHSKICKFNDVAVFIIERKMGASRKSFLMQLGRSKGFKMEEHYSPCVTHVVSENNTGDEVQTWITNQAVGNDDKSFSSSLHLLDISWLTDSIAAGCPLPVQDKHKLKTSPKPSADVSVITVKSYACQRRSPLKHHNIFLTEPLEILAENAEFMENEGRSIAFRRSASVLKALPRAVREMDDLKDLPCLGEHSLRVIKEILEDGASREVESTRLSEQFRAMKALTGVFGVGVKSADRWFREGLRSPADLLRTGQNLNRAQQADQNNKESSLLLLGVRYYDDLNRPVTKNEALAISDIVERAVNAVLPGAIITLAGGFRRGKEDGHDVDFLITHPEEGTEEGLMPKVVSWLEDQGLLLYQKTTRNSYLESKDGPARPPHNMDRFERCFSIFKLQQTREGSVLPAGAGGVMEQRAEECWRAVRVDLVVSPYSQFAYATLGWTGSKLFERELRRWAGQERGVSLSSHTIYDSKRCYLPASSEEEIFAHLGLEYIAPGERNA
ncbi:DNA-directed DNA/RNA polymerase mu isoform X2 [Brachyhypopomus gauderio]|uniref:DNA-directed DNA/RNA polymerase mu isoform X2 n=1 Tax=Brachyhypopomus gauderio TaxID=698409 RepID=UPI00404130CA